MMGTRSVRTCDFCNADIPVFSADPTLKRALAVCIEVMTGSVASAGGRVTIRLECCRACMAQRTVEQLLLVTDLEAP